MMVLLTWLLWAALLAALAAGLWALYRTPPAVSLTRDLPPSAFQGARTPLAVHVQVRSRLPLRYHIEDAVPRTVIPDTQPVFSGELLGTREHRLDTSLTLNARGVYDWPAATVRWADPLGLFWRSMSLEVPARLEVFPGTHGLILPDLLRPLLSEGSLSRTVGLEDPISLRGAREYQTGDPPGRIHWRLSARTGTLTVRELERTAASSLTIYLDTTAGGQTFAESAVRLGASLVREAMALDLPVAVASNDGLTAPGRGPEALHSALLHLARLQPQPGLPQIPPTRPGGNLMILTALAGDALVAQAMRARATASRVVIVAVPEGFYLEPGEKPRRQWAGAPDTIRELERRAGVLAGAGVLVYVLRGNQSVLRLGA
ncbi:DUF58 domain-containing protein [Deinococcus hohokamensis]|uniref:DUF58 domain-containing protein n=1 Tax=Deinococcus hohokamensis TaxID=309883 RepID=A0ABV9I4C9_9DEIO